MSRQFEQDLNSTIVFVLNTGDVDRLRDLFARFGLRPDEICLTSARSLMVEYGDDFWNEFATIGREVVNDRNKKTEIRRHYMGMARGDGGKKSGAEGGNSTKTPKTPKTQEQKDAEFEKGWGIFTEILDYGQNYWNSYNETQRIKQQGQDQTGDVPPVVPETDQKSNTGLIIAGVVVAVVVVALVLVVALKK